MGLIIKVYKECGPIVLRCVMLAAFIGAALGLGSSLLLEIWKNLTIFEMGILMAVCLWIGSLILSVYLTELIVKRRIYRRARSPQKAKHVQHLSPANHNSRHYYSSR